MLVQGYFDLRFEQVRDAFAELFEDPQERGAALCIQIGGETVVDLWAGQAGKQPEERWHSDSILNLYSCTKAFTAVTAMQLVGEGVLELDRPISHWWPAFAQAGKQQITLRQLLSHRAGLVAIKQKLPASALYDWQKMVSVLEGETPSWRPGSRHGYSPIIWGWLLGELLQRASGRPAGELIVERTAHPLELDFHLGLDDQHFERVAHLSRRKGTVNDPATQKLLDALLNQPEALATRAFSNPPAVMNSTHKAEWRRMVQPAANGHGNARTLASFYSGLLDGRLLDSALLAEMTRLHSKGEDATLLAHTRLGLGLMLEQPAVEHASFGLGPRSFGHPGGAGSAGVQPDAGRPGPGDARPAGAPGTEPHRQGAPRPLPHAAWLLPRRQTQPA